MIWDVNQDAQHRLRKEWKELKVGCLWSPKKKTIFSSRTDQCSTALTLTSFKVVIGDLHRCKIGSELTITAAGMTIKNN